MFQCIAITPGIHFHIWKSTYFVIKFIYLDISQQQGNILCLKKI